MEEREGRKGEEGGEEGRRRVGEKREGRRGEGEEIEGGDGEKEGRRWESVSRGRERSRADPKKHSPYPDGQPVHPYQAGAAHTHHAPHMMPPSVR